jgi:hypothetical protein
MNKSMTKKKQNVIERLERNIELDHCRDQQHIDDHDDQKTNHVDNVTDSLICPNASFDDCHPLPHSCVHLSKFQCYKLINLLV